MPICISDCQFIHLYAFFTSAASIDADDPDNEVRYVHVPYSLFKQSIYMCLYIMMSFQSNETKWPCPI